MSEVPRERDLYLVRLSPALGRQCFAALLTELGTNKTVNAIFWPWFEPFCRQKSFYTLKSSPYRSAAARQTSHQPIFKVQACLKLINTDPCEVTEMVL